MSGSTLTYQEAVHSALREEFAPLKNAAKILANLAGSTPRTAENWLDGSNAPGGQHLIRLMARCDTLKNAIDRLIEEERGCDR